MFTNFRWPFYNCKPDVTKFLRPLSTPSKPLPPKKGIPNKHVLSPNRTWIPPFKIERLFAKHEFSVPHLLCCSDSEPFTMSEVLAMGRQDPQLRGLWENLGLGYTETQGLPLLREEIAKLYHGKIPASSVVCVVPVEGIILAMLSVLKKGDHCIVSSPFYQSLYSIASSLLPGVTVSKWPLIYSTQGGWHVSLSSLSDQLISHPNTSLVVANFPHNPTGVDLSPEDLLTLVDLCRQHGCYLFSDEVYHHYDSQHHRVSAVEVYEHALVLDCLSKAWGLPGLRVGWLVSQDKELLEVVQTYKDYTTICGSAPSEVLAVMALRNSEKIFRRNLEILNENKVILDGFFSEHRKWFQWFPPSTGPIAFVKFLHPTMHVGELAEELLRKGVMILPDDVYKDGEEVLHAGGPEEGASGFFRLGFGRKNIKTGLQLMGEHVHSWKV